MASEGDKYFGSVCWFLGLLGRHAGDLIHLLVSQFLPRKRFGSRLRGGEMSGCRAPGLWSLLSWDPPQRHNEELWEGEHGRTESLAEHLPGASPMLPNL